MWNWAETTPLKSRAIAAIRVRVVSIIQNLVKRDKFVNPVEDVKWALP